MTVIEAFTAELKNEAIVTRKILEAVPLEKGDWKPHEKSMTLLHLASHVASLPEWITTVINTSELDFKTMDFKPFIPVSKENLLQHHDKNVASAETALHSMKEEDLSKGWTLRSGEIKYFTQCKHEVLRGICFNHLIHHRAQLGVYLRLLDVALPPSYGPTADTAM
jgi:uncharacterized damage-inducible protein DinB